MRPHASGASALRIAIALALGAASTAWAQTDTARTRIPVRKEATTAQKPAAPMPTPATPATDTSAKVAAKQSEKIQSVSAGEVVPAKDTGAATKPAPRCAAMTSACQMSAMAQAQPRQPSTRHLFGNSGFYVGAAAGTAIPYNQFSNLGYDSGFDITVPVGWHRPGRTLGFRATLSFDQLHADASGNEGALPAMRGSGPDPKVFAATLDAVLKFPIGQSAREGRGLSLYALGGGGSYLFRGFGGTGQLAEVLGPDKIGSSDKNIHKLGVQTGAGIEWGIGPTALFVESRWINVFTTDSRTGNDNLRWIPIGVGVTLR
jgi:hypothetical protein